MVESPIKGVSRAPVCCVSFAVSHCGSIWIELLAVYSSVHPSVDAVVLVSPGCQHNEIFVKEGGGEGIKIVINKCKTGTLSTWLPGDRTRQTDSVDGP